MRTYLVFLLAASAVIALAFPRLAVALAVIALAAMAAAFAAERLRRWWGNVALFGLLLAISAVALPAWAQDTAGTKVAAPFHELLGMIGLCFIGIVTVLLHKAYERFTAWTGIEVEATQRAAVLACVRRGVFYCLGKVEDLLGGAAIDVRSTVVAEALNYTLARVPAHVKALALTDDGLRDIAMAMFSEVQNGVPAAPALSDLPGLKGLIAS